MKAHTMMAFIHHAAPGWLERRPLEIEEHTRIVEALEKLKPERAKAAMEAHLKRGRDSQLADIRSSKRPQPERE
jgi:DNA-binding GntR family transcriptional regulator